jgi:hypothetical protein
VTSLARLVDTLSKGVKSGLKHVGHLFGIGSPSKWAALHIGKPLAAGIRGGSSKASAVSAAWPVRRSRAH